MHVMTVYTCICHVDLEHLAQLRCILACIMILQVLPDGSFKKLFWEQQVKALMSKDPRQRRWHPLIIKWCLNLRMMSSAAYENLRTTGMLVLPSQRTLRDYANSLSPSVSTCTCIRGSRI